MLAGGASTRFGSNKLVAIVDGVPLLHHPILRLAEVCREVIVVVAPGAEDPPLPLAVPARVVRDATEGEGPLSGALAALREIATDWTVVAGGDMPDLRTPVLLEMLRVAGASGADAVALQDGDTFRSLPLVVRSAPAREAAHALLHDGQRRLRAMPEALRTAVIDEPTWLALDPDRATLRDIDEPGDLEPNRPLAAWIPGEPLDAIRIVREGYDRIGRRYLEWSRDAVHDDPKERYLARILEEVGAGTWVVDLGCGPGSPVLRRLAGDRHAVGVDLSNIQLTLARAEAPDARLLQADATRPLFRDGSLDAVVSFFVLLHVPPAHHPALFARIAGWLRPGGRMYLSTGAGGGEGRSGIEPGWLGAPMYFAGTDADTTIRLVVEAGLTVESAEVIEQTEDDEVLPFLWIVAHKEATGAEVPSVAAHPLQ